MARVSNNLIGRASGSVGETVFLTWKLINVARSKPTSVYNPNTIKQQIQRFKYGNIYGLFQTLLPLLSIGLKGQNINKSLYNYFFEQNVPSAYTVTEDALPALVPQNLVISKGIMGITPITSMIKSFSGTNIQINWPSSYRPSLSDSTDVAYVLLFNETQNIWRISPFTGQRPNGFLVVSTSPNTQVGDTVHAWMFFKNNVSGILSDASYLMAVV